jgi:hypothetical protein
VIEAQVVERRRSPFPPWLLVAWLIWFVVFLPFATVFFQDATRGPYTSLECGNGSGGSSQWSWWPPGRECVSVGVDGPGQLPTEQTREATWSLAIQSAVLAVALLALVAASVSVARRRSHASLDHFPDGGAP